VVYLVLALVLGVYWSMTPALFDVRDRTGETLAGQGGSNRAGATLVATQIAVMETLLDKPGGFITNDIAPPGVWLDNMPNWEYGVVIQVRDMSKAMRETFS